VQNIVSFVELFCERALQLISLISVFTFFKSGEEGCDALNIKHGGLVQNIVSFVGLFCERDLSFHMRPNIAFVRSDILVFQISICFFLVFFYSNQDAMRSISNMED